jgi:hypothetical protein
MLKDLNRLLESRKTTQLREWTRLASGRIVAARFVRFRTPAMSI